MRFYCDGGTKFSMMNLKQKKSLYLSDVLVPITKTEQQVREDVDHVRFKQLPQHVTQHLKRKQSTCHREHDKLISTFNSYQPFTLSCMFFLHFIIFFLYSAFIFIWVYLIDKYPSEKTELSGKKVGKVSSTQAGLKPDSPIWAPQLMNWLKIGCIYFALFHHYLMYHHLFTCFTCVVFLF